LPGKPGLAGCPLDSQSPGILILSILTGQAKTPRTHRVLWAVLHPLTLTTIPRGFEAEVFTVRMPFLSPNKQQEKANYNYNNNYNRLQHVRIITAYCNAMCRPRLIPG